jgi:hypothetical protein
VIDDERPSRRDAEQVAQVDGPHRVASIEVLRPFEKHVILHGCPRRQRSAESRHFLALQNQLDFGAPQLLATLEILTRLVLQARVTDHAVDRVKRHGRILSP